MVHAIDGDAVMEFAALDALDGVRGGGGGVHQARCRPQGFVALGGAVALLVGGRGEAASGGVVAGDDLLGKKGGNIVEARLGGWKLEFSIFSGIYLYFLITRIRKINRDRSLGQGSGERNFVGLASRRPLSLHRGRVALSFDDFFRRLLPFLVPGLMLIGAIALGGLVLVKSNFFLPSTGRPSPRSARSLSQPSSC